MKSEALKRCPVCGSKQIGERLAPRRVKVSGHEYLIPNDRMMHCASCGTTYYTPMQAKNSTRKLNALKAERQGQLRPTEIRDLRRKLGWTQQQMERYLSVGKKVVTRWESGESIPRGAVDRLLRIYSLYPALALAPNLPLPNFDLSQITAQTLTRIPAITVRPRATGSIPDLIQMTGPATSGSSTMDIQPGSTR